MSPSPPKLSKRSSDPLIEKITEIGDTLHGCGCAPYKLEKYVRHYAKKHGIGVIVQATPTSINYHFPDADRPLVVKELKPATMNLGLLANTIIRLDGAEGARAPKSVSYRPWQVMVANVFIPPSFLILVGSSVPAIATAFALGFLVWVCQIVCGGERAIVLEFLSAFVVGVVVSSVGSFGVDLPLWGLCIAAIILFVPGLSIANSLECLAFNDLISGTTLLAQSLLVLMKLFIGIYLGLSVGEAAWGPVASAPNISDVPDFLPYLALPVVSLCVGVTFNARPVDIVYAFPTTILGMWGPLYLGFGGNLIVGTWVTSVLITLYGTWLAKRLRLTGAIYIVQGIIVLVPGSRVLMGASQSLFDESLMPIPSIGLSAVYMFSAIVTGQITAYAMYSQKNRDLAS